MQQGIHVIEHGRLAPLAALGAEVPTPWLGLLDVLRMVEGHLPEPPEDRPLGVVGLDALVKATPDAATTVLQAVRIGLVEARRYFAWKRIPLVLIVDGAIDDPRDGEGLRLVHGDRRWSLAPLIGTRLAPARPDVEGWWWAPQIG